jgi:O-antigen ligase
VFGVGWGANYGALVTQVLAPGSVEIVPRSFIHNQYLGVWLRDGILGLAALVMMLLYAFVGAARFSRRGPPHQRWLGSAVLGGLTAYCLSSIVGIFILDASSSVILMTLLAVAAILRLEQPAKPQAMSKFARVRQQARSLPGHKRWRPLHSSRHLY